MSLRLGNLVLNGKCHVMGILNVTPDSFYDGGLHYDSADMKKRVTKIINYYIFIPHVSVKSNILAISGFLTKS